MQTTQEKNRATHQISTPLKQENRGIHATEIEQHDHNQQQQRQQQVVQYNDELKNEKKIKSLATHQSVVSGGEGVIRKESFVSKQETMEGEAIATTIPSRDQRMKEKEENGPRERLKRHRREVAGQVWIPEMWGQEDFLKDWIDCTAFDASLMNQNIMLARASLVQEGRRANSGSLGVENSC